MSTRMNAVIRGTFGEELWFYRHSDGYPTGCLPTLGKFMRWVADKRIRDNANQASGWLVVIGKDEYSVKNEPGHDSNIGQWKVGAYEPTTGRHGDIEFLYILDLKEKKIEVYNACFDGDGAPAGKDGLIGTITNFDADAIEKEAEEIEGRE